MKTNSKKTFLFLSAVVLTGASLFVVQNSGSLNLFTHTDGSSTEYSLTLDAEDINFAGTESTVSTTLKNQITFQHSGLTNVGGFATITPGGYFMNKEGNLISGVKGITLSFDGDLTVEYAWENTDMLVRAELASDFTYNFNESSPSYIKIVNESESDVEITSFDITYSCQPVVKKVVQINYVKKSDSSVLADPTYLILDEGERYGEEGISGKGAIDIGGTKWLPNRYWVGGICDDNKQINITYTEASVYDGTVSTALSGTGTEADPYLISSAADLAYLHNTYKGKSHGDSYHYSLTSSIYMGGFDWVGICGGVSTGTTYKYFYGSIHGNGYTVGGLQNTSDYTALAFVSNTKAGCVIEDLVIEGAFNTKYSRVGGLCYWIQSTTIDNVVSYVDATSKGQYCSSLIGSINADSTVSNCESYGTVNGSAKLVGGISANTSGTVNNCINYGSITGYSTCLGGISGNTSGTGTVKNCINYGSINGYGTGENGCQTGGIAGTTADTVQIFNCINYGTVYGDNNTGYACIAGWVTESTVIYNCGNAGYIYGGKRSTCGTIAGYVGASSIIYGFTHDATSEYPACYNMVGARYFDTFYPAQEENTISAVGYFAATKAAIYDNTGL